jgi:hypothetical protein
VHKGKKAGSNPAYQDLVTAPLDRAHDEDIMGLHDEDENDEDDVPIDPSTSAELLQEVLTAVEKVNPLWSV